MSETPYFYFVVIAKPQLWPYYIEIPYTAWPDEKMYYNSNGNCQQLYDREWSYLDVMNWTTYENIIVWNAATFNAYRTGQKRLELEHEMHWQVEEKISEEGGTLTIKPIGRLWLYLLDIIPNERCEPGNAIIASFRSNRPELSASVARLFVQRLKSDAVWDGQTDNTITLQQLEDRYLGAFPLEESDALADEAHFLFSKGEAWYRTHPEHRIDWWKTLAQARDFLKRSETTNQQ